MINKCFCVLGMNMSDRQGPFAMLLHSVDPRDWICELQVQTQTVQKR